MSLYCKVIKRECLRLYYVMNQKGGMEEMDKTKYIGPIGYEPNA
jgi:hypothetical protein